MRASLLAAVALCACGPSVPTTPGRFGEVTSVIVVMNPVINQGSATTVASGSARGGVAVQAGNLSAVSTDSTGLALIENLPTGSVPISVSNSPVPLDVVAEKDLYDVVVSWDGSTLRHIIPPVRYPIGNLTVLEPGSGLPGAVGSDGAVIVLKAGKYPGNVEIRSAGVLIFGAWSPTEGPLSEIEGDVAVLGGGNRIRGVRITGKLTSNANGFSAAFNDVGSANITGNTVSLLRNRFTMGTATVPSSSAVLVDNGGIP